MISQVCGGGGNSVLPQYDFVHVNPELAVQASDDDPALGRFLLPSSATQVALRAFSASRAGRIVVCAG